MSTINIKYNKLLGKESRKSKVAKTIAVIATALSVAIVIISSIVADGFRQEIEKKTVELVGFARIREISQIFIDSNNVELSDETLQEFNNSIAPQTLIPTLETQAILQKGANLIPTTLQSEANDTINKGEIILSKTAAKMLGAKQGDFIELLSLDNEVPKQKSLKIAEVYSTGITEIEVMIAKISPQDIKEMVDIPDSAASFYTIKQRTNLSGAYEIAERESLDIETTDMIAPQIYGWLLMIDNNLSLILVIMLIVSIINIITSTLIVMLDSTKTIAMLRALGMNRTSCIKIFTAGVGSYALKGMIIGAIIGLGFGILQSTFSLITLDEAAYFVDEVPIAFNWLKLIVYTALMGAATLVSLLIPINIVTRLNIASSLKYQ